MAKPVDKGESTERLMPAKAEEFFALYVAMGPGRNLRALASVLVERSHYKTASTALGQLATYSSKYHWQERLSGAITAKIEEALAKAAEIDAQSFMRTSEVIHKRLSYTDAGHIDAIIKMRESVRRSEPKGNTASVNLNLSVTLRAIVERVAAEQGLDPDDVLAEAEQIIAAGG